MIQKYVIEAGISDSKVIEAMGKIPRHLFVETALRHQAYIGSSLPIGYGQTISHPTTVALMSQALEIKEDEKILEIGTGSGYQAAVLAEMGGKVFTIERIPELANRAQQLFEKTGYYTIGVKIGDGEQGWSQFAPFQRIILTAHSPTLPPVLLDQLEPGGILIMPLGDHESQELVRFFKYDDHLESETLSAVKFVPMIKR